MTFKKNYIGKGTIVPNMSIVKATVKVSELLKFVHEYEGEQYCTFEVAKLQNPDKFGRDHTVYCTTPEEDSKVNANVASTPQRKRR